MRLASLGIKQGDRIALMSENYPECPIADLCMLSLDAINVPLYPTLTSKQIEYVLNNSETKMAIVSKSELLQKIVDIFNRVPLFEKLTYM